MKSCLEVSIEMNPFLFGCIIIMLFWLITLIVLKRKKLDRNIHEFWWASFACSILGITEPLFVPEYWDPPSILKFYNWDLESFIFCFGVGGLAAVLTELPKVKKIIYSLDYFLWLCIRGIFILLRRVFLGTSELNNVSIISYSELSLSKDQIRFENMLLITFFFAMFGSTAHFNINIIYDTAIVCVATSCFIWWRRPKLKRQIIGGGISFTIIYTVVLIIVGQVYPNFYDHWNLDDLSGLWFAGAPLEEYLFSFTFGALWAPLYEAWKDEKIIFKARISKL